MNIDSVRCVVNKHNMLDYGDTVVVGFSGGADSVSLMHVLLQLKNEFNLNLIGAHVNHGIRGKEAERDENFCKEFCENNNVKFELLNVNVPQLSKENSMSEEEYGRKIRYEFFSSLAGNSGKIATAHNLNDCAETLLLNLVRGAGNRGSCSIPAVRGNIIRPLIECSREEIEEYCKENSLEFMTDSTNFQNDYSRNKIRNVVIPNLKQINPAVITALKRHIDSSKEDEEVLSLITQEKYSLCVEDNKILENEISKYPLAIKKRIVFKFLNENTQKDISSKHIEDILSIIGTKKSVNSAGGLKIQSEGGYLVIKENDEAEYPAWEQKIDLEKSIYSLPNADIELKLINLKDLQNLNNVDMDNLIDCVKISNTLSFRSRKSGDKFTFRKRNITKSLKKLFNEDAISASERNKLAILCENDNLVWLEGYGVSKRYAVTKSTTQALLVNYKNRG